MKSELILEPYNEVNYRSLEEAKTYAKLERNMIQREAWINGVQYFEGFGEEWYVSPLQRWNLFMRLVRRAKKQDKDVILP